MVGTRPAVSGCCATRLPHLHRPAAERHLGRVVRREQHEPARRLLRRHDLRHQLAPRRVERGRRLVQQEQRRAVQTGPSRGARAAASPTSTCPRDRPPGPPVRPVPAPHPRAPHLFPARALARESAASRAPTGRRRVRATAPRAPPRPAGRAPPPRRRFRRRGSCRARASRCPPRAAAACSCRSRSRPSRRPPRQALPRTTTRGRAPAARSGGRGGLHGGQTKRARREGRAERKTDDTRPPIHPEAARASIGLRG